MYFSQFFLLVSDIFRLDPFDTTSVYFNFPYLEHQYNEIAFKDKNMWLWLMVYWE